MSVTTVKRWVDEGVLPASRTAGGHRKLLMADVLRLVRGGDLPEGDLTQLHTADLGELAIRFATAIRDDDLDQLRAVILGGYRAGVPVETLSDQMIAPALHRVGEEWAAGRLPVLREHRITQACVSAVYELAERIRSGVDSHRPVAVGGAPEQDHTVLGTLLARLVLVDAGWEATNLGPHTPAAAFEEAIERYSPQLVWVSVTHLEDPERFLRDYERVYRYAERRGAAVAVGGRALTDAVRGRMSYTSFGDGLTHLAAFARTLHPQRGRPRRGRPPGANGVRETGDE